MNASELSISVIVPFYKGNNYINELLSNVDMLAQYLLNKQKITIEVIIVNDSPDIPVIFKNQEHIEVRVLHNERNLGIHASRVKGVNNAKGKWIIFLDQDDLLIPENYIHQINEIGDSDVVVGNGYYYFGKEKRKIYDNKYVMDYLICEKNIIGLRNLIPSPGECLIRKDRIPQFWIQNILKDNGSDDWFLWLLLFESKAIFTTNVEPVYIHRNSLEGNLSFDLEKMNKSNNEMCKLLHNKYYYNEKKRKALERSIKFKYLYDSKSLKLKDFIFWGDKFIDNLIYKYKVKSLKK